MNLLRTKAHINFKKTDLFKHFWLPQYTSIGSYTILYVDRRRADTYCAACATFKRFECKITGQPFWEGEPETCDGCGKEIESSYGPVENDE